MSLKQKRAKKVRNYFLMGAIVVFTTLCLSYPIYLFERSLPDPSITSLKDALWFQFVSVTTIGYGDLLVKHDLSKLIVGFNYLISRGFIILAALDASRAIFGKHTHELNNEERFSVISNELKLIHSDLYEINAFHHQAQKEARRKKNKVHDVTATNPQSLIDIVHSTICKNAAIHCQFELIELYTSDLELWLSLKIEAKRQGVHSISFVNSAPVKLQP